MERWVCSFCGAHRVLANISVLFLSDSPLVGVYIIEIDVFAWFGDVAAYGVGVEEAVVDPYVF